jgi:hypothetical protein
MRPATTEWFMEIYRKSFLVRIITWLAMISFPFIMLFVVFDRTEDRLSYSEWEKDRAVIEERMQRHAEEIRFLSSRVGWLMQFHPIPPDTTVTDSAKVKTGG